MTLEEAIKELQSYNFLCESAEAERLASALKLGIEALKLYQQLKAGGVLTPSYKLPGETEE